MAGSFFKNGALIESTNTTATAGATTTLSSSSATNQRFTGTSTQTIVLPDATTLSQGRRYTVLNRSTGALTVNYSDGTLAGTVPAGSQADFRVISNGNAVGTWDVALASASTGGGGTTSPLTTKGDLYVFSTINDRLPAGATGQVLSVDPTAAAGLKWTDPTTVSAGTVAGSKVVSAFYTGAPASGTLAASYNPVTFATKVIDTASQMSGSAYTITETGLYDMETTAAVSLNGGPPNALCNISIYRNANPIATSANNGFSGESAIYPQASLQGYPLTAGDVITVQVYCANGGVYVGGADQNYFSIAKRVGNVVAGNARTVEATIHCAAGTDQDLPANTYTKVAFNAAVSDSASGFDVTNNRYVAQQKDTLNFAGAILITGTTGASTLSAALFKNGTRVKQVFSSTPGAVDHGVGFDFQDDAQTGDYYEIWAACGSHVTIYNSGDLPFGTALNIRSAGQASALEPAVASYSVPSSSAAATSPTQAINFSTKIVDNQAAVTASAPGTGAWGFKAPATGMYRVYGFLNLTTYVNGYLYAFVNGAQVAQFLGAAGSQGVAASLLSFTGSVFLNQGDVLDLRMGVSTAAAVGSSVTIEQFSPGATTLKDPAAVVAMRAVANTLHGANANTPFGWDSTTFDTVNGMNVNTGGYTVKYAGTYQVNCTVIMNGQSDVGLWRNGGLYQLFTSATTAVNITGGGALLIECAVGDVLDIRPDSPVGVGSSGSWSSFSLFRLPDDQVSAGSQPAVSAGYSNSLGGNVAANSNTLVGFNAKRFDTGSNYNGVAFVAPVAGLYEVDTKLTINASLTAGATQIILYAYLNGALYEEIGQVGGSTSTGAFRVTGGTTIPCAAGDQISIYAQVQGTGASAGSIIADGSLNFINITRVPDTYLTSAVVANAPYAVAVSLATGTSAIAAATPIVFDTVISDSLGTYNPSTGFVTLPRAGLYEMTCSLQASAVCSPYVLRAGSGAGYVFTMTTTGQVYSGSTSFRANAGDQVALVPDSSGAAFFGAGSNPGGAPCHFLLKRISD